MLKICLVFWKSESQYAYKRYAYKKHELHLKTLLLLYHFVTMPQHHQTISDEYK